MSDGEWWGGEKAGVGGRSKYKNTPVSSSAAVERFSSEPGIFFVDDSPLLGQSASGLNFYDDSGRSPLAD
jgi:hypothetical protein